MLYLFCYVLRVKSVVRAEAAGEQARQEMENGFDVEDFIQRMTLATGLDVKQTEKCRFSISHPSDTDADRWVIFWNSVGATEIRAERELNYPRCVYIGFHLLLQKWIFNFEIILHIYVHYFQSMLVVLVHSVVDPLVFANLIWRSCFLFSNSFFSLVIIHR